MIHIEKHKAIMEAERLREEIIVCPKCNIERKLGFKRCDYHNSIMKYIGTWKLEQ